MTISANDFSFVAELMRREAAIVLENGKEYLVETRLAPLVREAGLASIIELVDRVRKNTADVLKQKIVEALTTNETSFFRDFEPFQVLRNNIIPNLMERRSALKRLSIWCAAASTGQEPYSIMMLLKEHFPGLNAWQVNLFATDICSAVLEKARKGVYTQAEVNRGLPATMLVKYFKKCGNHWEICHQIKNQIQFTELNLVKPWPSTMGPFDLVLIRNVLIYFDVEVKRQVLANVRKVLLPDGYILLGSSETTLNIDENLVRAPFERGSCYELKR